MLEKHNSCFVWLDSGYKCYYPIITANFIFLKLSKNTFDKNNNNAKWIELIKHKEKEFFSLENKNKRFEFAAIVINSHLDLNSILDLLNLQEKNVYFY